jgi:hypothetical protein
MRVRGSGSGFLGFGSGDKERSDAFKKGRRPGQKVRGRLIKKVSNDTAWVDIEGHKLLAQIKTNAQEGAQITFLIQQLQPNIILKTIFEPSSSGVSALNLASSFDTARTLFENHFRDHTKEMAATPSNLRKKTFVALLRANKDLFNAFLDAVNCARTIGSTVGLTKCHLCYMPWMLPTGRRHVTLTRTRGDFMESIFESDLPNIGMVRAEFLTNGNGISYKLFLQHKSKAADLKRYIATRDRSSFLGTLQCLDIAQLPQRHHGGIIAGLIFKK